jgi:hypothetical protein
MILQQFATSGGLAFSSLRLIGRDRLGGFLGGRVEGNFFILRKFLNATIAKYYSYNDRYYSSCDRLHVWKCDYLLRTTSDRYFRPAIASPVPPTPQWAITLTPY